MVRGHRGHFGIIQGKDFAISIDAHTTDAKLTGVDKASPLANVTPGPATRECLIEHRLPFHPLSLYHHELPQYSYEAACHRCDREKALTLNKSKSQNPNDN
jgi:hypothetical protein